MESPDDLISLLQARVSQAAAIKAAFPNDPAMAAKLIRYMIDNTAGVVGAAPPSRGQPVSARKDANTRVSHWTRIVEHFRATNNQYVRLGVKSKNLLRPRCAPTSGHCEPASLGQSERK
jgi:hypothetical protein